MYNQNGGVIFLPFPLSIRYFNEALYETRRRTRH